MLDSEAFSRLNKQFFEEIEITSLFSLFDDLPDILVSCKDLNGNYQLINKAHRSWLAQSSNFNFSDSSDIDFFPEGHAKHIHSLDQTVIRTAKPSINTIEQLFDVAGLPTWFISKRSPIFSKTFHTIGLSIIRTKYPYLSGELGDNQLLDSFLYIKTHYYREITIPHLAELSGLSVRQFERRFKQELMLTPQDFIVRLRVSKACEPLKNTSTSLAGIADRCGFYDQAAFSKLFKKHFGISPLTYRREYTS